MEESRSEARGRHGGRGGPRDGGRPQNPRNASLQHVLTWMKGWVPRKHQLLRLRMLMHFWLRPGLGAGLSCGGRKEEPGGGRVYPSRGLR